MKAPASLPRALPHGKLSARSGKKSVLVREGGPHPGAKGAPRKPTLKKPKKPSAKSAVGSSAHVAKPKKPAKPTKALLKPKKSTLVKSQGPHGSARPKKPKKVTTSQIKGSSKSHLTSAKSSTHKKVTKPHKASFKQAMPKRPKKSVLVRESAPKRPHGARPPAGGHAAAHVAHGSHHLAKPKLAAKPPASLKKPGALAKKFKLPRLGGRRAP